jgi:DNA repair protein RadD
MKLREYQQLLAEAIHAAFAAGTKRVLGVLPTGGGKTEVAIALIRELATPQRRALIVVERKVLCKQWRARLLLHGVDRVGLIQGENTIAVSAPVIVATIQSLRTRGVPEDVGLIVIDESHIWHASHDDVIDKLGGACVLGLTATPLREGLGLRFDSMMVGATIRELIDAGHLVRPRYFAPKANAIDEALSGIHVIAGDYKLDELSRAMRGKAIIGDVVGTWWLRASERQTIAFCVDKTHAHELAAEFVTADVQARVVLDDTDDDERVEVFDAFDRGEVRVLCSVGVLSIGFDSPVASCAILARPTCSLSLHIQQGGRVLRPFEGKPDALILDHAGNTLKHGLLEDFEPPSDLSQVDRKADKKDRRERADVWVCKHCEAVNARTDDLCIECGEPRRRVTHLVVIDGELRSIELPAGQQPNAPTVERVRRAHAMHLWYARHKGLRDGWAYHATLRRFKLDQANSRDVLLPPWEVVPEPTDDETDRWLRADFQRSMVARRYSSV